MKKTFAISGGTAAVLAAALLLTGVGPGGGLLSFDLASEEGGGGAATPNKVPEGTLSAEDLNQGEGGWEDIGPPPAQETRETKGKPRLSSSTFTTEFVCYREVDAVLVPEVIPFEPDVEEDESHKGAFRRKTGPGGPKGGSKLLAQRVAAFTNDGGPGGMTGVDKARSVLEELRGILEDPDCVELEVRSKDPGAEEGEFRVWDVAKEEDPELGDEPGGPGDKKNALHFRAITTLGSVGGLAAEDAPPGAEPVTIENDFIVIQRGRTLIMMVETSPGGYEHAVAEARAHAGKADSKMNVKLAEEQPTTGD